MTVACSDLEAAIRGEDPELVLAFGRHAATCPSCQQEWDLAQAIAAAAPSLRKEWPSPGLEHRIRAELRAAHVEHRRPVFWIPLAAAAACLVAGAVHLLTRAPRAAIPPPIVQDAAERLLSDQALAEVERAEAAYVAAVDALAKAAEPRLAEPVSPLLANYREKLLLLDSAIADCRAEADRNRFNAHLRLELLSIYREKQRTLESLLREDPHAS